MTMTTSLAPIIEQVNELSDKIIKLRRLIHANPELSFQEVKTSRLVVNELENIPGMHIQTGIANTGVIGTLSSGSGPTLALRADMDALPIKEANNTDYCSQVEGVMHACGHDAHTAILLGVAHLLGEAFAKKELQGTVKFIFQPAEEDTDDKGLSGAPYMIQAGALDNVDAAMALHMCPWEEVGTIQVNDGYSMASVDVFEGKIIGTGGHAAYPHLSTDPIWMLGPVLQALLGITARKISPMEPAVVSVTQIQAGTASNVIPTEAVIRGTLRSYKPTVREFIIAEVEKAFSLVKTLGGSYTFFAERGEPALNNHAVINQWIKQTATDLWPAMKIKEKPFGLGGEDFGYMTHVVPGAMFFLGCGFQGGEKRDLHTPHFDINEEVLIRGVAILTETIKRVLQGDYELPQRVSHHE